MAVAFEYQVAQLARAANDVAGILTGALVGLYQTVIDINPSNVVATFTAGECDYNTYAEQALVWADPSVADDGTVEVVAAALIFRPTDAVTPNVTWGMFILDTTAAFLLFAGQFDGAPLPLQSALQQVILTVRYRPATGSIVVQVN